jgi:hypothetical protein
MAELLRVVPPPIFNWMGEMPFPAMQALFDPFFPKGLQWYWKGDFVKSLPDEAIDTHIAQAAQAPSELSLMHLYPIDGAVNRVPKEATAWNARDARWSMVIAGIAADPQQAEALKTWGRAYWTAVHPFNLEAGYVNFMMDDEGQRRVQATYGDNYPRLAAVKAQYDPHNFFRVNQNIKLRPAAGHQPASPWPGRLARGFRTSDCGYPQRRYVSSLCFRHGNADATERAAASDLLSPPAVAATTPRAVPATTTACRRCLPARR